MNGKGDSPRNCFTEQFRDNYDHIFRRKPRLPSDDEIKRQIDSFTRKPLPKAKPNVPP